MAIFPGPQDSVFWHDFESLTDNNLWKDQGPHSLHATPQAGFSSPAYGLSRTPKGKGYATFTGAANCYATLPTRFNDVAPTSFCTFVAVVSNLSDKNHRVFSSWNEAAGNYRGFHYILAQTGASFVYQFKGDATLPVNITSAAVWSIANTSVVVHSLNATGAAWTNRNGVPTSWAAGAFGTAVHDAAVSPCIGKLVVTPDYLVGRLYLFALFPFVFTDAEAKAMSDWLRDRI
jgi:hypothetical protein